VNEWRTQIEREAEAIARLKPSEARPLLLEVARAHAARRDPASLLAQYEHDGTVAPAEPDARLLHELDGLALAAADGFEAVELAPVLPLGTNAVLGHIDQNNVLSTVRNTEVLADPTAALALECVRRRRAGAETVRLCAVARVLRLQPIPDVPGFTRHFRIFALVTAGRARPHHGFESEALAEHVGVYLRLLDALRERGSNHTDVAVELSRAPAAVLRAVPQAVPDPDRREAINYYDGPMLRIAVSDREGNRFPLADGGTVDWSQRLLANSKERMLTSAIGHALIATRFL
jgi:hypothetical protein